MIKKILPKIQSLEKQKQTKLEKIASIQAEIDDIDLILKKLNSIKRDYEKLENNSTEILNNLKGKSK